MPLASVSVYELSRLAVQAPSTTVRRRSNSTKVRRKDDDFRSVERRRRSQNPNHDESFTITYLGRPSETVRHRSPAPSLTRPARKQGSTSSTSASTSSASSTPSFASGLWADCIEVVRETGLVARRENKKIRRLKVVTTRRMRFSDDEELVLTATRMLSKTNDWSLDACHEYLPIIIENIASCDAQNREIALEGLAAITDTMKDRICKFAGMNSHRIGVDVAAEERCDKAKACIQHFRSVVKKRDWYYKQLDEVSIDKLDRIMEKLKRI